MFTLRWTGRESVTTGTQLGKLMVTYGSDFTGRVPSEVITVVVTKPPELDKLLTQTADIHSDKEASTQTKKQQLKEAARYVGERRKAIGRTFPKDPSIKKDFGVGQTLDNDSLDSVSNALEIFTTAARAAPEKIAAAGILATDLDYMDQALLSLKSKATVQHEKTVDARRATLERNELQHELEEAIMKVVGAATLIYEKRPNILALFKACLPPKRSRSRKQGTEETDSEGTDTSTPEAE